MGEFDVGVLVDCVHTDTVCAVQGELLTLLAVSDADFEHMADVERSVWRDDTET